jgi:hypothetical protein
MDSMEFAGLPVQSSSAYFGRLRVTTFLTYGGA